MSEDENKNENKTFDDFTTEIEEFRKSPIVQSVFPCFSGLHLTSSVSGPSQELSSNNESNSIYKNSPYFFNLSNKFVHYTSVENAFNIVNENAIRLYDLNFSNDPNELLFGLKNTGINKIITEEDKVRLQESLFNMSFFKLDNDELLEDFNMWRFYGKDGYGVALVFEIFDGNIENWMNTHLSRIYYGQQNQELNQLKDVIEEYLKIHRKYNISEHLKTSLPDYLLKLLAFHKNDIWQNENEIRLAYYYDRTKDFEKKERFYELNKEKQLSSYIKIQLFNDIFYKNFVDENKHKQDVFIQLNKVIIGYRYNSNQFKDLSIEFKKLANKLSSEIYKESSNNRFRGEKSVYIGFQDFERSKLADIYFDSQI